MTSIVERRDLIQEHEERFASLLAGEVLPAPKMSLWMILIPFVLVYHVIQHRRVMEGRRAFIRNYLQSRRQALEESIRSMEGGGRPHIEDMLKELALPASSVEPLREFFGLLTAHYLDLLRSDGSDVASMIRSAYRNRTNYLLFLNRLSQAEKALYEAVKPRVAEEKGVDEVLAAMEEVSQRLRKEHAAALFP